MSHELLIYQPLYTTRWSRPLMMYKVPARFPSPAEDYIEGRIDLNRDLIKHPIATLYIRVIGDSMRDARIDEGDLLVVDRAAETNDGDIVVARLGNDLTIKRLCIEGSGRIWLCPENPAYQPIEITEEGDFEVWGRAMYRGAEAQMI